jgi:hypothetical protein
VVRGVDGLVDLSADQKEWLYDRVRGHLSWHRKRALPKYAKVLAGTKERLADGLDERELAWIEAAVRLQARALVERVLPDAAALLAKLDQDQVRYLEAELTEAREEAREELARPLADRKDDNAERFVDLVEDWVGPLTEAQRAEIETRSRALPSEAETMQNEKERRQEELLRILTEGQTKKLPPRLRTWLLDRPTAPSKPWQQAMRDLTLAIDRSLTKEQRAHLLNKIDGIISEIAQMAQARSAAGR